MLLLKPDVLLDSWRDAYDRSPGHRLAFYSTVHGSGFQERIAKILRTANLNGSAMLGSFSAAQWPAPYARASTHHFYANEMSLIALREGLELTSAARGENVIVIQVKDDGMFNDAVGSTVTADYVYDGLERLAVRTTQNMSPAGTTHYLYDLSGRLIVEASSTGNTLREYIWLDDVPLAVVSDVDTLTPNLYYVHPDHLNRPVMMTNVSQGVVWDATYKPFGAVHAITGAASNNLRFPGQYYLLESGLHYNWHRHYDPTIGRYLQPDPMEFVDGPSIYAYALSAPTMEIDPQGLMRGMRPGQFSPMVWPPGSRMMFPRGPSSAVQNVTRPRARDLNRRTDVCAPELQRELQDSGFHLTNPGSFQRGRDVYQFYMDRSFGAPAMLYNPGGGGAKIKYRLPSGVILP